MERLIFSFPGNEELAASIATQTKSVLGEAEIRHFPDGESYVRILSNVCAKHVWMVCRLDRPDAKLASLYYFSKIARSMNATSVSLVCPYLPYMRQDKSFHSGEGVTSRFFAEFISSLADELITIDPHLHRFPTLDSIYTIQTKTRTATDLIGQWIRNNITNPFIVGPDMESEQWVKRTAEACGAPFASLRKIRSGDKNVSIHLPDHFNLEERTPVLVDDIISTGKTMIETVQLLKGKSVTAPVCVGVHGIFAGQAYEELRSSGVAEIVTTNAVLHPSNQIDISTLLLP